MVFELFGHSSATLGAINALESFGQQWDRDNPDDRLRQIHRDSAPYLWALAFSRAPEYALEVGAGSGFSTIWIASALAQCRGHLVALEPQANRIEIAEKALLSAGLSDFVTLSQDPLSEDFMRSQFNEGVDFCFLDSWKEDYQPSVEMILPFFSRNAVLVADNAISHQNKLESFFGFIRDMCATGIAKAALIPVGEGLLVVSFPRGRNS